MRFVFFLLSFIFSLSVFFPAHATAADFPLAPIPSPTNFNPALLPSPPPPPATPTPVPVEKDNKTSMTDKTTFPLWLGAMGELVVDGHWSFGGGYGNTPGTFSNSIGGVVASMTEQSSYQSLLHREFESTSTPRLAFEYRTGKTGWNFGLALYYFSSSGGIDDGNILQSATGVNLNSIKNMLSAAGSNASIYASSHVFDFELHVGYTVALAEHLALEMNAGVAKIVMSTFSLHSNSASVDSSAAAKNIYEKTESELGNIMSQFGLAPMTSLALRLSF